MAEMLQRGGEFDAKVGSFLAVDRLLRRLVGVFIHGWMLLAARRVVNCSAAVGLGFLICRFADTISALAVAL